MVKPSLTVAPPAPVIRHSSVPSGAVPVPVMPMTPAGRCSPSAGAVICTGPLGTGSVGADADGSAGVLAEVPDEVLAPPAGLLALLGEEVALLVGVPAAGAPCTSWVPWPQPLTTASTTAAPPSTRYRRPVVVVATPPVYPWERSERSRRARTSLRGVSPGVSTDADCPFCRIAAGDLPADVVERTERVVAFRDLDPQAPLHVLVVPVDHHADVTALAAADDALLGEVVRTAAAVAGRESGGQYRLVWNTGPQAGQSVAHVHAHVLGGRRMGWPPG